MLKVQKRACGKKYGAFNLRREGAIPGIVYGGGLAENIPVRVDLRDFRGVLAAGKHLLDLEVDGQPMKVLLKAVQHGTFDTEILHADFRAIDPNESIEVELPIELAGLENAPGPKAGGIVEQSLHHVRVRCVPARLPDNITVDISAIEIGQIRHASELPALEGVSYVLHGDPAVVSCHLPRGEEEAAGGEAAAAPEVIGEKEREERAKE